MLGTWNILTSKWGKHFSSGPTIDSKIERFNQCKIKLQEIDKKLLGLAVLMEAGLWITGLNSLSINVMTMSALAIYGYFTEQREEHAKKYQAELKNLLELYQEMVSHSTDDAITDHPNVKALLETIAPYVMSEDLIFWKKHQPPANLSSHFKEILARSPHRIQFLDLRKDNFSQHPEEHSNQNEINNSVKKWSKFFEQTAAETTRVVYGIKTNEEKSPQFN